VIAPDEDGGTAALRRAAWDGEAYYDVIVPEKRCQIHRTVPPGLSLHHSLALFNRVADTHFFNMPALGALIERSQLIERRGSENGATSTYRLGASGEYIDVLAVEISLNEPKRLLSIARLTCDVTPEGQAGEPIRSMTYTFSDWNQAAGVDLPGRMVRESFVRDAPEEMKMQGPLIEHMIFERLAEPSDAPVDDNPANFRPELPDGWTVIDLRLNLIYDIGARRVSIDGVECETTEPMRPELVDRLAEILVPMNETDEGEDEAFEETEGEKERGGAVASTYWPYVGAAAAICLLALAARRLAVSK
jgi:hypothetical protein